MAIVWGLFPHGGTPGHRFRCYPEILHLHQLFHVGIAGDLLFHRGILDQLEATFFFELAQSHSRMMI